MKLITALLSGTVAGLAIGYVSLYLENQHLHDELALLQTNYTVLADVPKQNDIKIYSSRSATEPKSVVAGTKTSLKSPTIIDSNNAFEENIKRMLEKKYAILFSTLNLSDQAQEHVWALLMERERILSSNNIGYLTAEGDIKINLEHQQILVAKIDNQISAFLKPDDIKKFELLKDSSYEQNQINNFYDGLADNKNLSQDKRNTLLLSKLEQKHASAMLLEASAEEINNASPFDKKILADRFKDSLRTFTDNYLRVAKENLNDEQFALLRDSEQKQFEEVWGEVIAGWQQ